MEQIEDSNANKTTDAAVVAITAIGCTFLGTIGGIGLGLLERNQNQVDAFSRISPGFADLDPSKQVEVIQAIGAMCYIFKGAADQAGLPTKAGCVELTLAPSFKPVSDRGLEGAGLGLVGSLILSAAAVRLRRGFPRRTK